MFVHADQIPQWPILAIMDQCAQFMKYRGKLGISVGVFDSTRNKATSSVPDLSLAMAEFQHSTRQHIQVGESLFSVMPFTNTACIWARYPLSKALDKSKSRFALILIGVFLFSFFALFSYQRMILGVKMIFPIRWRLVILFGFAGGFPLVVVKQSGWDYLHQKYLSRIRETHDETERALKAFDVRFTQMRGLLETKINLWVKNLQYDTPTAKETAQKRLKKIYERFECSHINLYDGNGKITWNALPENTNKKNRGQRFMGGLVRNIVAKLNNEEKDVPMDMATMALETFSGSENPIINLIRNMSTIMYFGVQEDQNWLFLKTLTGNDGRTTHAVFFYWQSNQMESVYLKHYLLSAQRNLPGTILYAVNTENRSWDFPKKFKFAKRLNRFISDLKLRQTTTYGELSLGTKKYLVTGVKPKELSQILLIAIQSDEPINQEIKLLVNRLWLFSLTSVAISLFLGLILSQRFLLPINQLSEGVGAIQRRDFNHRIPPGEPDELGKLSETFNKVMEGLIDLEVGRIVQESLFPVNEHKVGEFRLYGMTKSATELGGDYFDLQPLSDGRVLILIGDVSGHGVPAALVMAMAKALVERECESSPSPERVLSTLHRIFFKTLKRLRMMTCFMALLDPLRNVVIASNAGHNYPYLFRKSEAPRSLEVRSFPLGSKKNIFFTSETVEIKPGDRILFYTDGLVEAKVGQEPVGYDRMVENIRPLLEDDPRRSCEKIFSWHRALCGDGPQEDDITVALLTRQSA
ncbi:SpoIIE family protein phosphatase [bacterium]|nr:SpoIIE family protein phosphatase [bacterium]